MKIKDLEKIIPLNKDDLEVDPVPVVENKFFYDKSKGDYREKTIEFLVREKIGFQTSFNIIFEFVRRYVRVVCPTCLKEDLKSGNGGGNSDSVSITFVCPRCKTEVYLSISHNGIGVDFKKE